MNIQAQLFLHLLADQMPLEISKLFTHNWNMIDKGQITSKGLFGILRFFQKTNEQIRF